MCWGMPSTLSQAVYNSASTFMSCLYRASRSVRGERLLPSQVFSEYAYSQHLCMDYRNMLEFLKAPTDILFLSLSFAALCSIVYPNYYSLPQAVVMLK